MGPVDIAIVVIVSVAAVGVTGWLVYRKIKGKGGCDCGCGGCSACDKCKNKTEDTK